MKMKLSAPSLKQAIEWLLLFQLCIISVSIAAASIALAAAIILYLFAVIAKKEYGTLHTPLTMFIAAYAAVEFLSTAFSLSPGDSLHNAKRLLLLFLIPMTVFSFASEKSIRRMVVLCGGIVAFISCGEILFYYYESIQRLYVFQHYMTTGGLKMIFCLLLIPFILDRDSTNKERLYFGLIFSPIFIALILTNTRSSWMGFIAGVLIIGILYYRQLFVYFVAIVLLFFLIAPKQQTDRAKSIIDPNDPTNKGRLMMWSTGVKIWKDYPILGIGDIDIYNIYQNYKSPDDQEPAGHLHNNVMTLLVTVGLLGLLAVTALIGKILHFEITAFSRWKKHPFARNMLLGTIAVMCGFLMNGMFEWNFGDHEIMVFVWFSVGTAFAVNGIMESRPV